MYICVVGYSWNRNELLWPRDLRMTSPDLRRAGTGVFGSDDAHLRRCAQGLVRGHAVPARHWQKGVADVKYSVITFGCRVNQADSLGFEEVLRERGDRAVPAEEADFVLVNTCSVTASADQAARQAIRRVARNNPRARIVVTGCYATREPASVSELQNVIAVFPNSEKPRLLPLLTERGVLTTAERFGAGDGSCGEALGPGIAGRTAFTLRVQ